MGVTAPAMVKAKTRFRPIGPGNAVTLGLATASLSDTRQSYTSSTVSYWDSGKFNTQGQKWAALQGGNPAAGVANRATPRGFLGVYMYQNIELEFHFTGTKLDIQVLGTTTDGGNGPDYGFDIAVWVEYGDQMIRLAQYPISGAGTSAARFLNIAFAVPYSGRIHVICGRCHFVGVGHESSAIVRRSPDRDYMVCDGDSYMEPQHAQNAGAAAELAFYSMNLPAFLFERTGWICPSRAQGATGFFNNANLGGTPVSSDSVGALESTRIGSASRMGWMINQGPAPFDFDQKIGIYLINGTWNDKNQTGGQLAMYARAKAVYQAIVERDPHLTLVQVGVEPYWGDAAGGAGAVGSPTGPPTSGSVHHLNNLGMAQAAAEVARTFFINPFGPTDPWFTGKGDFTTLGTDSGSQQAQLTGRDHIHGNYAGYQHYAARITAALGEISLPMARANRQV